MCSPFVLFNTCIHRSYSSVERGDIFWDLCWCLLSKLSPHFLSDLLRAALNLWCLFLYLGHVEYVLLLLQTTEITEVPKYLELCVFDGTGRSAHGFPRHTAAIELLWRGDPEGNLREGWDPGIPKRWLEGLPLCSCVTQLRKSEKRQKEIDSRYKRT